MFRVFSDCSLKGLETVIVAFLSSGGLTVVCAFQIRFIFDVVELDQVVLGMLPALRTY